MNINQLGQLIFEKNAMAVDEFEIDAEGQLVSTTDESIVYDMVDDELIRVGGEVVGIYD